MTARYDDYADQQTDLLALLDRLTRRDLGERPPGVRPYGDPARYCQALVPALPRDARSGLAARPGTYVVCYGALCYDTDALGRTIAVCQRDRCRARTLVPRVVPEPEVRVCHAGHRMEGENVGRSDVGPREWCRTCRRAKNARAKAKRQERAA
jgi:hypothetical protein